MNAADHRGIKPRLRLTSVFAQVQKLLRLLSRQHFNSRSPRFAKYQPALRLGTRRVEGRLLGRITRTALETSC
jgi:hypothetical protein